MRKISNSTIQEDEHDESEDQRRKDFLSYFNDSKLPNPDCWPDNSPIFVSASKRAPEIKYQLHASNDNEVKPFPLDGSIVPFSGPLFRGKIVSRMRDVPSMAPRGQSPPLCSSDEYFKGRSRQFQWTVQGVFSKRCRFDKVVTGQDFTRPFRNAPSSAIVKRGMDLLRNRLPETFECDLFADKPRFEHPLICGCQNFRVDNISSFHQTVDDKLLGEGEKGEIVEDCTLLGDDVPKCSERRRKFFCKPENLEKYYFEPSFVYTFDFYANFFSPSRHRLEITPFFSIDLIPYFNGQPLFMAMAKEQESGKYLWGTEAWHSRLLNYDTKQGVLKRFFRTSKSKQKCQKDK